MSTNQLFFAVAGLMVTLVVTVIGLFKHYIDARFDTVDAKFNGIDAKFNGIDVRFNGIDAKLDRMSRSIDTLVQYMVDHSERIARLEERTKHL